MIKLGSNKQGFTLTEVLVSMVILMVVASAIATGVVQASNTLTEIRLKELAFEKLKSETDLLKAKIFNKQGGSVSPNYCDNEYCLGNLNDDTSCPLLEKASYCYSINPINTGSTQAAAYEIITQIRWSGIYDSKEKELSFYTAQMVWSKK